MSRCKVPRQATALALAAVLTVAIAACGGGDDEPEPTGPVLSDASSEQTVPPLDAAALAAPGEEGSLSSLAEEERPAAVGDTLEPGSGTATLGSVTDYTVQAGDTLWEIAARFETTVEVLVALNGLVNAGALDVGQVILLPASEAESEEEAPADGEAEAGEPDGAASGDEAGDGEAGDGEAGVSPDTIPQPDPDVTVSEIPDRPADFGAFGAAALPWLHGRTEVSEILPLFEAWSMPSVAGSDRLHLVDSDLDGLFSILIVYTDPASFSTPLTVSNLVIYDPIPDRPERYRMAYDHRLRSELESSNIIVRLVQDVTGDGRRDVTFHGGVLRRPHLHHLAPCLGPFRRWLPRCRGRPGRHPHGDLVRNRGPDRRRPARHHNRGGHLRLGRRRAAPPLPLPVQRGGRHRAPGGAGGPPQQLAGLGGDRRERGVRGRRVRRGVGPLRAGADGREPDGVERGAAARSCGRCPTCGRRSHTPSWAMRRPPPGRRRRPRRRAGWSPS